MKKTLIATLAATALLAGCATPGYDYGYYNGGPQYAPAPQYPAQYSQYPQYAGPPPAPANVAYAGAPAPSPCVGEVNPGHIIGGIAGAILGAQIGRGNGRTAAAAIGAATGALAGGNLACR
jgi:hypothetical protein